MTHSTVETLDLVVFLAVAQAGSMGAAADELRLATPSVSARMSTLEHKLGSELFVRSTRGSSLTPAGTRLVPYARRTLALLQDAHSAVAAEERERFTVASPATLAEVIFPTALDILEDTPLSTNCRVAHSEELIGYLLDGTVDVAFLMNQMTPSSIVARRLRRSKLIAVSPPGHALAGRRSISVDDLLDHDVAVYRWDADAEALADIFGDPLGRREHPVPLIGLPSILIHLVTERDYVAVVPEFSAASPLASGSIAELALELPGWSLDVQVAYRRDAEQRSGVATLMAAVDEFSAVVGGRSTLAARRSGIDESVASDLPH